MIDVLQVGADFGTEPSLGDGVIRITAEVNGSAVLDLRNDSTGIGAIVRTGTAYLDWYHKQEQSNTLVRFCPPVFQRAKLVAGKR
jgi:hypothetical protein